MDGVQIVAHDDRRHHEARAVGARRLFLEGNRRCAAAVHLYAQYGFREIPIEHTDYARCDIQMTLTLPEATF